MTLRYRPPVDHGLRPSGRWARILAAVSTRVAPEGEIRRLTATGEHSRVSERAKTHRAIRDLDRLRLITRVPDFGWTITPLGRARLNEAQAAQTCPAQTRPGQPDQAPRP